ncbi:MAG: PAS domain S-box protein [Deltaproteobacteria bacterium]|nr:PAS domain S-box protein [Deltaproteobacteria bacterium]
MILPLTISFIAFVVCLLIGFLVYYQSSKKLEHKLFLALCLVNAWMALSEFLFIQSAEPAYTLFWAKTNIAPSLAVSVAFHFVLAIAGIGIIKKKWFLGIVYIPNILIYLYILFTGGAIIDIVRGPWGNEVVYNVQSPFLSLANLWITIFGFLSFIIPLIYYFKTGDIKKKKQLAYISLGFFLPTVMGSAIYFIKPITGIDIPKVPSFFTMLLELLLGYAVWKFGLLDLNPATAVNNIVETISDLLVIIDRNRRIVSYNNAVLRLSCYQHEEIIDNHVNKLFPGNGLQYLFDRLDAVDNGTKKPVDHNIVRQVEDALVTKKSESIPVNISVSILHEKDGEKAGYVLVARDITSQKIAENENKKLITELREAIENVKTLKGFIPICAKCKKVRDDQGYWSQIEKYISEHSDALISHGICPECAEELYGNEDWYKSEKK